MFEVPSLNFSKDNLKCVDIRNVYLGNYACILLVKSKNSKLWDIVRVESSMTYFQIIKFLRE